MAYTGLRLKKSAVVLSAAVMPLAGGAASASASQAQSGPAPTVACLAAPPPGVGWWKDSEYLNPEACLKCTSAGAFWESTGEYNAYCRRVNNPAGTITRADLYLSCKRCRNAEPSRRTGRAGEVGEHARDHFLRDGGQIDLAGAEVRVAEAPIARR
ncbi:hypothetical protein ITP53_07140 [Nonomuraea sp. K274]|uniref:Uncharacterized protein n=1 Tax=Nonomuraea cypriaca TaxID=1187855 RepID=A0A931A8V2_9ACTN|nr:hypothetical protein [Nonomuraea cypriaca]MBF8185515.1 hypothetical protein [Nonomuraea cypriaca]